MSSTCSKTQLSSPAQSLQCFSHPLSRTKYCVNLKAEYSKNIVICTSVASCVIMTAIYFTPRYHKDIFHLNHIPYYLQIHIIIKGSRFCYSMHYQQCFVNLYITRIVFHRYLDTIVLLITIIVFTCNICICRSCHFIIDIFQQAKYSRLLLLRYLL